jgi:hypothetical protein
MILTAFAACEKGLVTPQVKGGELAALLEPERRAADAVSGRTATLP